MSDDRAGLGPRLAALHLLNGVIADGLPLDHLRPEVLGDLAPAAGARAATIATGVLRARDALDRAIDPHLRGPTSLRVRQILRIAAWEMCADGIPPHAAVNAAVAMCKAQGRSARSAGMVNAVARQVAAARLDETPQVLPPFLRGPMTKSYGKPAVATMEAVFRATPPLDLTVAAPDRAAHWADVLGGTCLPTGSVRLHRPGQITALPGFAEGAWWVQDVAAAQPVRMLGDLAGLTCLDLCAAPGGKTLQLAALGADVTAVDISAQRLARLGENLGRTGLSATVRQADALTVTGSYDLVLLDAPCSASGTIRRHPDLPFVRAGQDLRPVLDLQARLLRHAMTLVRPGGRLVYVTCSLLPAECAAQIKKLPLDGWRIDPAPAPDHSPDWTTAEGYLRLRPDYWADIGGMDGFFAAILRRDGQ